MNRPRTIDAAQGKWPNILSLFGMERSFLSGKHGPCPMCGGTDRFRFDNKEGRGTYFCSSCGAGNGMDLVQKLKGWDFRTAASEIDRIVGNCEFQPSKPAMDDAKRKRLLNDLWQAGRTISHQDQAGAYLAARGLPLPANRAALRFVPSTRATDGINRPAMVAMVTGPDGMAASLHRTFLGPEGKAHMDMPRALMPGGIPEGCAVRLSSVHGHRLGIAEGIETALAASALHDMPVWAAINATMLAKWKAPEGVTEVVVFGDNDAKFGGHAAAYAVAHRIACQKGMTADVRIPPRVGTDWADVLVDQRCGVAL